MGKSKFLVLAQFSLIIILLVTGKIFPSNSVILIFELIFLLFGFWAIIEFKFRFNIFPDLKENSVLKISGPYKFVRHPMYTSVIGYTLLLVFNDFSNTRIIFWIILLIVIFLKLTYEERLLNKRFPDYSDYASKTKRLIPFIY